MEANLHNGKAVWAAEAKASKEELKRMEVEGLLGKANADVERLKKEL